MSPPLVTIAIPFVNNDETLPDAVRSVFAQTFQNWELLLVNDGSQDRSLAFARSLNDPRVSVISDGHNRGLPARLNQIAQLARGEFLARMDADDLMHPCRIAEQVSYLQINPDIDVVGSALWTINEHSVLIAQRGCQPARFSVAGALKNCPFMHPAIMGRTAWFLRNPYNEAYRRFQDGELFLRAMMAGDGRYGHLERLLFFYREPSDFDARKLIANYHSRRQLAWKFGPQVVGVISTGKLIAQSYLKQFLWRIATCCHQQQRLFALRNEPLSDSQREDGERAIQQIRGYNLPTQAIFTEPLAA